MTDSEPGESAPGKESDGGTTPQKIEISRREIRTSEICPEANDTDAVYPHGIRLAMIVVSLALSVFLVALVTASHYNPRLSDLKVERNCYLSLTLLLLLGRNHNCHCHSKDHTRVQFS